MPTKKQSPTGRLGSSNPAVQNIPVSKTPIDPKTSQQISSIAKRAERYGIIIRSDTELSEAGELLKTIKGLRAAVDEAFDPIIKSAHETHKQALAQKKKSDQPLLEAETLIKRSYAAYIDQQERLRKREEERLRLQAEQDEKDRITLEAAELIEEGRDEEAKALLDEPVVVETAFLPVSRPVTVSGISTVPTYRAEVDNFMELLKAVLNGVVPTDAVEANMQWLNGQARLAKRAGRIYPGVTVVAGSSVRAGQD